MKRVLDYDTQPFQKLDTTSFKQYKMIGSTIEIQFPALKDSKQALFTIYYAKENNKELIAKCINLDVYPTIKIEVKPLIRLVTMKRAIYTKSKKHIYYLDKFANAGSLNKYIHKSSAVY